MVVVVVVVVETAVVCGSNSSPCVQAVFYSEDEGMEPEEPVAYRGLHTPVRSRLMLHALFFFLSPSPRASHTHTHTHTHTVCSWVYAWGVQRMVVVSALPKAATPRAPTPGKQKRRRRWSAEEEEQLRRGVSEMGAGCWKEILQNFEFDVRGCVSCGAAVPQLPRFACAYGVC